MWQLKSSDKVCGSGASILSTQTLTMFPQGWCIRFCISVVCIFAPRTAGQLSFANGGVFSPGCFSLAQPKHIVLLFSRSNWLPQFHESLAKPDIGRKHQHARSTGVFWLLLVRITITNQQAPTDSNGSDLSASWDPSSSSNWLNPLLLYVARP